MVDVSCLIYHPELCCSLLDQGAETHHELCRLGSLNGLLLASLSNRRSGNEGKSAPSLGMGDTHVVAAAGLLVSPG